MNPARADGEDVFLGLATSTRASLAFMALIVGVGGLTAFGVPAGLVLVALAGLGVPYFLSWLLATAGMLLDFLVPLEERAALATARSERHRFARVRELVRLEAAGLWLAQGQLERCKLQLARQMAEGVSSVMAPVAWLQRAELAAALGDPAEASACLLAWEGSQDRFLAWLLATFPWHPMRARAEALRTRGLVAPGPAPGLLEGPRPRAAAG